MKNLYQNYIMTQIAVSIDQKKKNDLTSRLKKQWITTKWFFLSCVDAYLNNQFSIWIISNPNEPFSQEVVVNESAEDVLAYMKQHHERAAKTV